MAGRIVAAAFAVLLAHGMSTEAASAQEWPTRTVTMIVPFPAGGPVDLVGRVMAARLSETLGQQIIVENVGGAGGMSGAARVAKSPPDGSVFLFGNQGTHTFSQILYSKPLYNAVTDFVPVAEVIANVKVLAARKDLPANTLVEFITYAKANQDKMQFGSAGSGSATHVTCLLLNSAIGVDITHVPYRGTGPAMQDLMGGRIDYLCDVTSTAASLINSGVIKAIAVLSPTRSKALPNVPTADEQGLKDFDTDGWNAFFLPKGTPEPIVQRLAKVTADILDEPDTHQHLEELGLKVPVREQRTPEYLTKLVQRELDKWGPPLRAKGVSAD